MDHKRRDLLKLAFLGATSCEHAQPQRSDVIPLALVQFDARPEQLEHNTRQIERLSEKAVELGARWVMFHEGTLCDYTPNLKELAQFVPDGKWVRRIEALARRLNCYISYGLSEADNGRYYIAQVFTGPRGFIHRYRKTWIWRTPDDKDYRDEWLRYDPGSGPELFTIDGVCATCFICADGESKRCLTRVRDLSPEVVFHPNNRGKLGSFEGYAARARAAGAPLLVTNRVGMSWNKPTTGGCVVYAANGDVLAHANREGREEILRYDLKLARTA